MIEHPTVARIAAVISESEVVFTAGANHGIDEGSGWVGTVHRYTEIKDPTSGELLGRVKRPLVSFFLTEVQAAISVGSVIDQVELPDSRSSAYTPGYLGTPTVQRKITTDRDRVDWQTVLVSVGDEVEFVRGLG